VATVTGVTTCTDTGLTNGTTYHYLVRAVDAATNVGPRSETIAATPDGTPPAAVTSFAAVVSAQSVHLSWTPPADADLAGVKILRTTGVAPSGPDDPAAAVVYDGTGSSCDDSGLIAGTSYHYAAYACDTAANYSAAARVDATAAKLAVKIGRPMAPATVKHRRAFTVYGSLTPRQPAGATSVRLRCYLKKNGKWVLKRTVATKNADHELVTRYSVSLSLPAAGRWKLVAACAATAQYRAATSTPEYLKVK
jgi:chitodextrinase